MLFDFLCFTPFFKSGCCISLYHFYHCPRLLPITIEIIFQCKTGTSSTNLHSLEKHMLLWCKMPSHLLSLQRHNSTKFTTFKTPDPPSWSDGSNEEGQDVWGWKYHPSCFSSVILGWCIETKHNTAKILLDSLCN